MPTVGPSRRSPVDASRPLVRAAVFAVVAVYVSVAAHLLGGGARPDESLLLLAVALVTVLYRVLLAGRERSWPVLAAALAAAEAGLHELFGASLDATGMPLAGHAGMAHGTASGTHRGLSMIVAHAVAAVLLGWVLRHGERAAWSAARTVTGHLLAFVRRLVVLHRLRAAAPGRPAGLPRTAPDAGPRWRHQRWTSGPLGRRGPPSVVAR
jgi:hypothetical protein